MVRNMGKFNTSDNKSIKPIYNNDTTVSSSSKSEISNEVTREEIVDFAYRVYKANGSRKPNIYEARTICAGFFCLRSCAGGTKTGLGNFEFFGIFGNCEGGMKIFGIFGKFEFFGFQKGCRSHYILFEM